MCTLGRGGIHPPSLNQATVSPCMVNILEKGNMLVISAYMRLVTEVFGGFQDQNIDN